MKSDFSDAYIKRLDLNLLWVFYALLKHHKVTTAAEYLSMTQSAVSQALARLRTTCDDPLFVRTGHGLKPTARALALEPYVTQIIETATRTFAPMPCSKPDCAPELRIGMPDNVSKALTSFAGLLRREAPNLRLSARHVWGRKGVDALIEGEIDLALFHIANASSDIERRTLYYESFAVIARRGHPVAASFDLSAFCEADHVVASFAGDGYGLVDAKLEQLGRTRRVVSTFPLFRATLQAVACSDMIALVNRSLALAEAERLELVVLTPPRELELSPFPVHVAWHRRQAQNALCRWTADQIIKHMPEGFAYG
ncbi:MAG TPA: LysR family transcriptional regulator [Bradyrhizobium sp.]|nr:LysR family transcriptional regulator [Bradyrhizobium sp.]